MADKVRKEDIEKHELVFFTTRYGDRWDDIDIEFDGLSVGMAHFMLEKSILVLEEFSLKKYGLSGKGIGRSIIEHLKDHYTGMGEREKLLFFVEYDPRTNSNEFYEKCGFKYLERSKEFTKEQKTMFYMILDQFFGDSQVMYLWNK